MGYTVVAERYIPGFLVWVVITTDDPSYLSSISARFLLALASRAKAKIYVKAELQKLIERRIEGLGFKVEVKEPFSTTLAKGPFIVDVYVHPTLGGMIYMDGQELLNHVCIKDFNGLRIKSLESYA